MISHQSSSGVRSILKAALVLVLLLIGGAMVASVASSEDSDAAVATVGQPYSATAKFYFSDVGTVTSGPTVLSDYTNALGLSISYVSQEYDSSSGDMEYTYTVSGTPTGAGTAKFTVFIAYNAKSNGVYTESTDQATFTVYAASEPVLVTSMYIVSGNAEVAVGSSIVRTVSVSPSDADDTSVTWSIVSGSQYISISPSGAKCTITGLSPGTAVIKCSANDASGKYATATITVPETQYEYTLSYNANGGSGAPATQYAYTTDSTKSAIFTISTSTPTRSGYTFQGWSYSASATLPSSNLDPGKTVSVTYPGKTLYAVWSLNTSTYYAYLYYDANGGVGAPSTQKDSMTGTSASGSATFTVTSDTPRDNTGRTFLGWSTSSSATTPSHIAGSTITVAYGSSKTLYAVWAETCTITLNANGGYFPDGSGSVRNKTFSVASGSTYGTLDTPTRDSESVEITGGTKTVSYTFDGWYTAAEGGTKVSSITTVTSSHSLFAHWTSVDGAASYNTYSVAFLKNADDATGTMSSQSFTYGTEQRLSSNRFERTGYTFVGWASSPNGAVAYTDGQKVVNLTSEKNGVISLYAVWKPAEWTITFHANNDTSSEVSQTIGYDEGPKALTANSFTKNGSTFIGWSTSEDGPVLYADKQEVSCPPAGGELHLYAVWQTSVFTVTFEAGTGGSVNPSVVENVAYGTEFTTDGKTLRMGTATVVATSDDGYAFSYWGSTSGKITADRTIKAVFAAVTGFTVSPSTVGTTASPFVEGSEKKLSATVNPSSVRDSVEWTTSDEGIVRIDGTNTGTSITIVAVSAGTATVTAKVAGMERTCTVTVSALTVAFDDKADRTVQTTDRTTVSWTTNGASSDVSVTDLNGEPVAPSAYSVTGSGMSRTVVFSQAGSYMVKVTATSGAATAEDSIRFEVTSRMYTFSIEFYDGETKLDTITLPQTAETSQAYTIDFTPKAEANAEFRGWSRSVGSTDLIVPGSEVTLSSDDDPLRLYANWRFSYSLAYVDDSAMNVPKGVDGTTDRRENITVPISSVVPTFGTFIFAGWATSPGGVAEYGHGDGLEAEIVVPYNEDVKLYSVWADAHTCSVTYISESEAVNIPDADTFTSASTDRHVFEIAKGPTSQYGYVFKGWALSPTGKALYGDLSEPTIGSDVEYDTIEVGCDENVKLYAVWEVRVTYDGNGGTPDREYDDVRYGNVAVLPGAERESTRAEVDGGIVETSYILLGWSADPNRLAPDEGLEQGCEYAVKGTVTLYAIWKADKSESGWLVRFDPNGGVCETETLQGSIDELPPASWETESEPIVGGHRDTVHTFLGWSVDKDATEPDEGCVAGDPFVPTEDVTLYAVWETVPDDVFYRVTFDPEGGECDVSVTEGVVTSLPDATRGQERTDIPGGYRVTTFAFLGWSASSDATEPDDGLTVGERFVPTDDIALHAVWEASSEDTFYTLTYDPCNGDRTITARFIAASDVRTIRDLEIAKEGHVLLGWSTTKDSDTAEYVAGGSIVLTDDTTLYAVWAEQDAEVHTSKLLYDARGGSISSSKQVSVGTDTGDRVFEVTPLIPVKAHWRFMGWAATEGSDTADYHRGDTVTVPCDDERTLYAVWEPIMCSVTFDSAEGSEAEGTTVQEGSTIALPSSVREGYDLEGWYLGDVRIGGAGERVTVDSDLALTAHWKVHTDASDDDNDDMLAAVSFGAAAVMLLLVALVSRIPYAGIGAAICGVIAVILGVLR